MIKQNNRTVRRKKQNFLEEMEREHTKIAEKSGIRVALTINLKRMRAAARAHNAESSSSSGLPMGSADNND